MDELRGPNLLDYTAIRHYTVVYGGTIVFCNHTQTLVDRQTATRTTTPSPHFVNFKWISKQSSLYFFNTPPPTRTIVITDNRKINNSRHTLTHTRVQGRGQYGRPPNILLNTTFEQTEQVQCETARISEVKEDTETDRERERKR